MFKNSVHTAKKTQRFAVTKINFLTPYKEITVIYTEYRKNPSIQNAESLTFKADGYHLSLKD
jgi:hypothetical protein